MIHQPFHSLAPRAITALCLAIILAGCGPTAGVPAQSEQPTQVPAGVAATPAAPTAQPPTAAPTSAPVNQTQPATPASIPAQPATSAPIPTPETVGGDEAAAVQSVLDYYDAINEHAYDRAYRLWARNGAASGQTLDQFKQGFDGTYRVSVQIGKTSASGGDVAVPIAIASVVGMVGQEQQVQRFQGSYTVQLGANGWQLAGANIAKVGADPQPSTDVGDPLALLQAYYAAINKRDFGRAYTYWDNNGMASQQTFAQFSQGFADTDRVTIDAGQPQTEGAAGTTYAQTPIVIMATQKDGSQQSFCGTYLLRRAHVPPFDQLGWRIDRASIAPVATVQPGTDAVQRLLANGCRP